jgi:hypothetical protein
MTLPFGECHFILPAVCIGRENRELIFAYDRPEADPFSVVQECDWAVDVVHKLCGLSPKQREPELRLDLSRFLSPMTSVLDVAVV